MPIYMKDADKVIRCTSSDEYESVYFEVPKSPNAPELLHASSKFVIKRSQDAECIEFYIVYKLQYDFTQTSSMGFGIGVPFDNYVDATKYDIVSASTYAGNPRPSEWSDYNIQLDTRITDGMISISVNLIQDDPRYRYNINATYYAHIVFFKK